MKKVLLFVTVFLALFTSKVWADVDYSIPLYQGQLTIDSGNEASFKQMIIYDFDSSYNGQYITLGSAGNFPKGFSISGQPEISAYTVDGAGHLQSRSISKEVEKLSDGYRVKVYNPGKENDRIALVVTWRLKNLLNIYSDIAELNWVPISDWDVPLNKVIFEVNFSGAYQNRSSQLYAHTGYFGSAAKVTKKGNGYSVEVNRLGEDRKLELHAYWDRKLFYAPQNKSGKGLSKFLMTEKTIAVKQKLYPFLATYVVPLISLVILVVSLWCYYRFKASLGQKKIPRDMHLFEAPSDLSPLVLTKYIYDLELAEIAPPDVKGKRFDISFENLIQATLLDLIDQGKLILFKETGLFDVPDKTKLTAYERDFLDLVYGGQPMGLDSAFLDYQTDKKILKGNPSAVRQRGRKILALFESRLAKVDASVAQTIAGLNYPDLHREMLAREKRALALAFLFAFASIGVSLALLLFSLAVFYPLGMGISVFLILLAGLLPFFYYRRQTYYQVSRILTAEGLATRQAWDAFQNMLRDIKTFEALDIESHLVWNRILVYAALYGYADRVQDYLKLRHITLENPELNTYIALGVHSRLALSSHYLSTYTSTANSASHFSISSGGSGGGGFSGGFGGGGGGAF